MAVDQIDANTNPICPVRFVEHHRDSGDQGGGIENWKKENKFVILKSELISHSSRTFDSALKPALAITSLALASPQLAHFFSLI